MATPPARRKPSAWGECLALPENRSALRAVRSLAHALARPVPRITLTPLVLHGPSGTGKSLLVQTLSQKLAAADAVLTIQTIPAADLARAATAAEDDPDAEPTFVDESLRTCDLFILEDLHYLPAKAAEAVCRLLDRRTVRRRATVVTMNVGPGLLTHLPRRLTSRLVGGLAVSLEPFSPRSRKRLLRNAARTQGLKLAPDGLDWLAEHHTGGGIRPLLGLVNMLAALGREHPFPLDARKIQDLLAESGEPPLAGPSPADIVKRVATAFSVAEKELLGPSRLRQVRVSRQVAMYLVRELTELSLPRIGAIFDGRDHTTVLHACRKVEQEAAGDRVFAGRVKQLMAELR